MTRNPPTSVYQVPPASGGAVAYPPSYPTTTPIPPTVAYPPSSGGTPTGSRGPNTNQDLSGGQQTYAGQGSYASGQSPYTSTSTHGGRGGQGGVTMPTPVPTGGKVNYDPIQGQGPTGIEGSVAQWSQYKPPTSGSPQWNPTGQQGSMMTPGAGENWWSQYGGQFTAPTASSQYWNSVAGGMQGGLSKYFGGGQVGNPAGSMQVGMGEMGGPVGGAGDRYGGAIGQTSLPDPRMGQMDPTQRAFQDMYRPGQSYSEQLYNGPQGNLDSYYQRTGDMAQEKLDNAMAARGLYNSGVATDQTRELWSDLASQQANREADYRMNLAGQADAGRSRNISDMWGLASGLSGNNRANDALGLNFAETGGRLAQMSDATRLNYLNSGMSGAFGAQGAFEDRNRGNLNDALRFGGALSGVYTGGMDNALADYYNLGLGRIQGGADLSGMSYDAGNNQANRLLGAAGIGAQIYGAKR